ncbi:hypothetical protein MTR_8g074940 [Medicago truncatula]|uniref:Reverse transcriptase zinc-binding domain-containing protein n=1 Tax=Medicago truncatula TaxID=3880 RepID=G7LB46_MEDTR|nr:hypothetical protein MTR_8g074940 [Medicago truncatula]
MSQLGWGQEGVTRGGGGGGCLRGRRRRLIGMPNGCGHWNHLMYSLFGVCPVKGCAVCLTFVPRQAAYKDNLHWRGVLDRDARMWLGISAVILAHVQDHFNQFSVSGGIAKTRRSISQVIWFATVWEIWKERNNRHFNDKICLISQVVDRIKSRAFRWLKEKFPTLPFNYHGWRLSPFTLLDVGL